MPKVYPVGSAEIANMSPHEVADVFRDGLMPADFLNREGRLGRDCVVGLGASSIQLNDATLELGFTSRAVFNVLATEMGRPILVSDVLRLIEPKSTNTKGLGIALQPMAAFLKENQPPEVFVRGWQRSGNQYKLRPITFTQEESSRNRYFEKWGDEERLAFRERVSMLLGMSAVAEAATGVTPKESESTESTT